MKTMKRTKINNHLKNQNQGFSLVEVLVCLAIVAIFCVPLFQGFRYAAYNNSRAHHTQEVTAYAQKTLEAVRSMRIDEENPDAARPQLEDLLRDDAGGDVTTDAIVDTALRDTFDGTGGALVGDYAGDSVFDRLFTVLTYRQENINIGGRIYHMDVELDPRPYSVQPSAQAEEATMANDVNVYGIAKVNEVDGLKFPLIADEIHRYEENQAILHTFQARAEAIGQPDLFGHSLAEIYHTLYKRILVTITQQGTSNTVTVTCDVEYEITYGGYNFKEIYNVYTGIFDLDCGRACSGSTPAHSHFTDWKSGGKIFIFAKAYKDGSIGGHIAGNEVIIESNYGSIGGIHADQRLDVYLVRGVYSYLSDNFTLVQVNGIPYSTIPGSSDYLVGEGRYGNVNLHTNIKGILTDIALTDPSDREQAIGREEPRLRNYDVTVTLTERDTGNIAARVTTTKKVM